MNKKGWIEIVESFTVILLIMSILLIVVSESRIEKKDFFSRISSAEVTVLREFQLNKTYREDILGITDLPSEWEDSDFPARIKERIIYRMPDYLECSAKICRTDDPCYLSSYPLKDTYAQSVIITSTPDTYDPRQLKIFCWMG